MKSGAARDRVLTAMKRLPNVLETQRVAHQKTLEQKIAEQGPRNQRVDPHLLGYAIRELSIERRIVATHHHEETNTNWFANARLPLEQVTERLNELAPLYAQVAQGAFKNKVGDALEIATEAAIQALASTSSRYAYLGTFDRDAPLNKQGRIPKVEPPDNISGHRCPKLADFHLFGFETGPICVECKNLREWIYPGDRLLVDLLTKALRLHATPLLVARRLHYTTVVNFLVPAGVLVHETYYQYYPPEADALAARVRDKTLLGFTDVTASYQPARRTTKFFTEDLPKVADRAAKRFNANRQVLEDFVSGDITLAQLYAAIDSPAARDWRDAPEIVDVPF